MATSHKYVCNSKEVTFGAEFELVDWPRNEKLPDGMEIDDDSWSQVNSNGVAVDGPGKLYNLGGEILARPCGSPDDIAGQMAIIKRLWPEATHNFRGGLHIHIRVPGLRDNLKKLKKLQSFVHKIMPDVFEAIDKVPIPVREDYPNEEAFKGAKANRALWKRSHQTLLSDVKFGRQMAARTPQEFFEAEALHPESGNLYWATQPRCCVNLRQMLQTDTVEFRHYPGSADPIEVKNATLWCKAFMEAALDGSNVTAQELLAEYGPVIRGMKVPWPEFPPYDHWLFTGFMYTTRHFNPPGEVPRLIKDWLDRKQYEVER
jgi:hypothetical protein